MQEQRAQRVVDLVGDAGRQLAHAGQLAGALERLLGFFQGLVRLLQLLVRRAELLDGVGEAHIGVGQAGEHGVGVVDAGVVAAGAAVEQVLGLELAHAVQDVVDILERGGLAHGLDVGHVLAGEIEVLVLLEGPVHLWPSPRR